MELSISKKSRGKEWARSASLAMVGGSLLMGASTSFALPDHASFPEYSLKGTCAFLPADRATEFHGNPATSNLNLGMAGNQWVVFDNAMRAFNLSLGNDPAQPAHRANDSTGFKLADLNDSSNKYFIELIPPGQIRKQIKSGCMTLGNDEERNFLPGNYQVDFDVFASTNYNLMQDLANNGFIDEAVPYIRNRLDLMVASSNADPVGSSNLTGDAAFDRQFDIIMDLLSGNVIASSLDHINEGIHNAANGYMKKAHGYVKANDVSVSMTYTYADMTTETATKMASVWIQDALNVVATPMVGSPSALRLVSRDAGEKHSSHDLSANGCGVAGAYTFCEFAVLNKANTHESRVHHVETPNGVVNAPGFEPVDVGFVWITELAFQINAGNTDVTGMNGTTLATLGIPNTDKVNADKIYSLALLATSKNMAKGRAFIEFLRSTDGQQAYIDGGFTGLVNADAGKCYGVPTEIHDPSFPGNSGPLIVVSAATNRTGPGSCADWLGNGSF